MVKLRTSPHTAPGAPATLTPAPDGAAGGVGNSAEVRSSQVAAKRSTMRSSS